MSLVETVKGLTNCCYANLTTSPGTAFWYFLRGSMRIISPTTVAEWFRPPGQYSLGVPNPTDLELYNIRTDAWGLLTLAMLLLALADAVPLPASLVGSSLASPNAPSQYKKPYARAAVLITLFHHVATGVGAYQHWRLESHHTVAMDIGVYGNVGLIALGVSALGFGLRDGEQRGGKVKA
ncbi:hypothetical protein LTR54_012890 [Friedmanniomyces endolithicus]|nr:hypothetical protein LTS00_009223 [Friedmanniomyces endolithicus]KAK0988182.1 hypothetical protein LTR54_012890 [Friedmanniomyces endolithicus]